MEFTLHYRGELKANRGPADKHSLRCHFHKQLKELWNQLPLAEYRSALLAPEGTMADPLSGTLSVVRQVGSFKFAPLVSGRIHLVAELRILLLRPEAPGKIITQAGDIDNRIKTLLDSLKVPHESNALPHGAAPTIDQEPFFCLVEDDNLITGLAIETDRLLERKGSDSEVVLIIRVKTTQLRVMIGTIGLS